MNFLSIHLGEAYFPQTTRTRVPFTFPTAVRSAHAVLQSFQLETDDSDGHVKDAQVSLITFFDPVQSTTSGEVEVEIQRTDLDDNILWLESNVIEAEVRILVIGI
jgi:hypothetical protein